MNNTVRRIVGLPVLHEADSARADAMPDFDPDAGRAETPDTPDSGNIASMADLYQDRVDTEQDHSGTNGPVAQAVQLWREGQKYELANYMLHSNFLYRDFVEVILTLGAEGLELGSILDEIAVDYSGVEVDQPVSREAQQTTGNSGAAEPE